MRCSHIGHEHILSVGVLTEVVGFYVISFESVRLSKVLRYISHPCFSVSFIIPRRIPSRKTFSIPTITEVSALTEKLLIRILQMY